MDKNNHIDEELEKLLLSEEEMADLRNAFQRSRFPMPNVEEEWNKIADEIHDDEVQDRSYRRTPIIYIGGIVAIAACLLLAFLLMKPSTTQLPTNVAMLTINETNKNVTLTKNNGEVIAVDSSELSFVPKRRKEYAELSDGEMISMATPRGKDCHLVLSDGTKVWLNDESKLEFPSYFGKGKRVVRLKGEAFFEVAKDRRRPFVVKNDYFTTTVLGTVFNVRAYDEHDANIVLVSGRVALNTGFLSDTKYLSPGEMAVCNGRNQWNIHNEDTYSYVQRKEGYFYFDHISLHKIMAEIGRWYNKTVVFENTNVMSLQLHFVAERKQSLASIIDNLNMMDGVNVELGKDEIVVR